MDRLKLKAKLVERGMKQGDLATGIGVNRATLSHKMNGDSDFTLDQLKKIIQILGLTHEEFISIFFAA